MPSKVAVSSAVQNRYDFPEHLLDGKNDTAWNSKTGDLVNGWISFRVPDDARVLGIEMTAGFDRVKGGLDLFTANHRITKVSVSRNGTPVGEFTLDPKKRGLQSIPIDRAGGDYVITVMETLPGTKKEWKELTVSELRVVGIPGKERRAPTDKLRVGIGSLDEQVSPLLTMDHLPITGSSPSLDQLCKDILASIAQHRADYEETAKTHDLTLGKPTCRVVPVHVAFTGDPTFKRVAAVQTHDGISSGTGLVVETPRGWTRTGIGWGGDSPLDPGCPSIVRDRGLDSLRIEHGNLVAVLLGERYSVDMQGRSYPVSVKEATWCREEGGKLVCRSYMAQYNGDIGDFAISESGEIRLLGGGRE